MDIPTINYLIDAQEARIRELKEYRITLGASLAREVGSFQMDTVSLEWNQADRVLIAIDSFAQRLRKVMEARNTEITKIREVINKLQAERARLEAEIHGTAKAHWDELTKADG